MGGWYFSDYRVSPNFKLRCGGGWGWAVTIISNIKSKFCLLQSSNLRLKGGSRKLNIESQIYESQIGGGGPTTLGQIPEICTFLLMSSLSSNFV